MGSCCGPQESAFDGASRAFRRALYAVIAINFTMFVVEMGAGVASGSQALKADALDFAADSATYTISLLVIGQPLLWRARVALLKDLSLAAMAVAVLVVAVMAMLNPEAPRADLMSGVALLALLANVVSGLLLLRWRNGDSNVRSVWLCTRNDAVNNCAVIAAGVAVWMSGSAWPDLIVALFMASLFAHSALRITTQSRGEMRSARGARPVEA